MNTLENLKQISETLNEKINELLKEVDASADDPRLVVIKGRLFMSGADGQYKYLNKSKSRIAKQLAQERYQRELLKVLEKQKECIERCIRAVEKAGTENSVYTELPEAIKKLINPDEFTDAGFAIKWQSIRYRRKQVSEKSPYYTAKGEHVRSKSEVIIADRLNANGVPYHYEMPVSPGDFGVQCPDFIVLNKRTRKEMFWEHFGMMEDPQYCRDTIQKLENFEADGCVLGRDLIVSFESAGKPLSTKHIDQLIADFLK